MITEQEISTISTLWLDDQIEDLSEYIVSLDEEGFCVKSAADYTEALNELKSHSFDLILVDINMPENNGIKFLREIKKKSIKATLIVLSSYLNNQDYIDQLKALDYPVELMNKFLPSPTSEEFKILFANPLKRIVEKSEKYTVGAHIAQIEEKERISSFSPFDLSLEEWIIIPPLEKEKIISEVWKVCRDLIEKEFSKGKIWVLICGDPDKIRTTARKINEIPDEDEVIKMGRKYDSPPYQFTKPISSEDTLWSDNCELGMDKYPTLSFDIGDETTEMHFDTGCPLTFMNQDRKTPVTFLYLVCRLLLEKNNFQMNHLL